MQEFKRGRQEIKKDVFLSGIYCMIVRTKFENSLKSIDKTCEFIFKEKISFVDIKADDGARSRLQSKQSLRGWYYSAIKMRQNNPKSPASLKMSIADNEIEKKLGEIAKARDLLIKNNFNKKFIQKMKNYELMRFYCEIFSTIHSEDKKISDIERQHFIEKFYKKLNDH